MAASWRSSPIETHRRAPRDGVLDHGRKGERVGHAGLIDDHQRAGADAGHERRVGVVAEVVDDLGERLARHSGRLGERRSGCRGRREPDRIVAALRPHVRQHLHRRGLARPGWRECELHAGAAGRQCGHHVLLATVERYAVEDCGEKRQFHVVGRPRDAWSGARQLRRCAARPPAHDGSCSDPGPCAGRRLCRPSDAARRLGDRVKFRRQVDRQTADRVVDDPLDDLSHPVSRHGDAPHLALCLGPKVPDLPGCPS